MFMRRALDAWDARALATRSSKLTASRNVEEVSFAARYPGNCYALDLIVPQ
jgi:hypothetical protein